MPQKIEIQRKIDRIDYSRCRNKVHCELGTEDSSGVWKVGQESGAEDWSLELRSGAIC